jgi:rod shape-determining protein MreD
MIIALQIALCLGTVVAQATLSTMLAINGIYPDLCLVLACLFGFFTNEYKGFLFGLMVGLFQDLLAPGGVGINMILKGLAGGLAGMTAHTISTVTTLAVIIVTLALSLGCGLASLIMAYPELDGPEALRAISRILGPQGLYNSLLAAGFFWFTHMLRNSLGVVHFIQGRR